MHLCVHHSPCQRSMHLASLSACIWRRRRLFDRVSIKGSIISRRYANIHIAVRLQPQIQLVHPVKVVKGHGLIVIYGLMEDVSKLFKVDKSVAIGVRFSYEKCARVEREVEARHDAQRKLQLDWIKHPIS